jgi:hypothetical protein
VNWGAGAAAAMRERLRSLLAPSSLSIATIVPHP